MIGPLMGYVLKVGMTSEKVDLLLGPPNEESVCACGCGFSLSNKSITYNLSLDREGTNYKNLVLDFSLDGRILTNFYIQGEPNLFVF